MLKFVEVVAASLIRVLLWSHMCTPLEASYKIRIALASHCLLLFSTTADPCTGSYARRICRHVLASRSDGCQTGTNVVTCHCANDEASRTIRMQTTPAAAIGWSNRFPSVATASNSSWTSLQYNQRQPYPCATGACKVDD